MVVLGISIPTIEYLVNKLRGSSDLHGYCVFIPVLPVEYLHEYRTSDRNDLSPGLRFLLPSGVRCWFCYRNSVVPRVFKRSWKDYEGERPIIIEAAFQANDDKDRSTQAEEGSWCEEHRFKCSMARMLTIWDGENLVTRLKDIVIPALKKARPEC
jgi:hypothetical protein